jgi:cell filamentation protein
MPGIYGAFDDPYVYKGTTVLKNKIGLRDQDRLSAFEVEMTTSRAEEPLPAGNFDTAHYRAIHRHLYQDVYRWAGRYRSVRMSKGGNHFCYPENILAQMNALFQQLRAVNFLRGMDADCFVSKAARFLGDLNAIHPFREGNGRTQLTWLALLADRAGHPLRLDRVRPDTFLPAMIASFDGNLEPLTDELGKFLAP